MNSLRSVTKLSFFLLPLLLTSRALAAESQSVPAPVAIVHSPDSRPCLFFTLQGVTTANSVLPNVSWFAVSQSGTAYKEILAMVLTAQMTGKSLIASTTGNVIAACGFAEVNWVMILP